MAHNEAASVVSFVRLQGELAAHGAPADLLEQVRRAARDEVRHARVMGRLARNHGAQPVRPTHVDVGVRPLAEIARENAIEGCVAETWSALLCTWQARHSVDPEIAAALRQIAVDETRHAELAWSLAAWMRGRLDAATNASIDAEREAAAATLVPSLEITMGASARAALGLPSTEAARILASGLQAAMAA
jgi:rubrerythrin